MSDSCEHSISLYVEHEKEAASVTDENSTTLRDLEANEKIAPVFKKLKQLREARKHKVEDATKAERPKIQRVPIVLREQKLLEKYYGPRLIFIGPIHHSKPKLQLAEKQTKLELAERFIDETGLEIVPLYEKIKGKIHELKKCFDEDVIRGYKDDDETLSWMLFFDGCSTLQLIRSYVGRDLKSFNIKKDQIALVKQDLLLLENQIPFRVLKLLMESSKVDNCAKLKNSVEDFVRLSVMAPNKYKVNLKVNMENPEPAHLLDLLRTAMLERCREPELRYYNNELVLPFRSSLQDLKAAGVQLKPSESCSLRDITFTSKLGFINSLTLPPIIVDDSTSSKFVNLIAYEMCPDNSNSKLEVTSFLCFLDTLISSPKDIKELSSADIVYNLLGNDKEVFRLFKEIATNLVPSTDVYESAVAQIQSHYKSKWRIWFGQVYRENLRSPYTMVAILAAATALVLTGIQTRKKS